MLVITMRDLGKRRRHGLIGVLFAEMYVNVVFVVRCLNSAVSLTLVKEQRFIRIMYLFSIIINYSLVSSYW